MRRGWMALLLAGLGAAGGWLAWRFLPRTGWDEWRSRWRGEVRRAAGSGGGRALNGRKRNADRGFAPAPWRPRPVAVDQDDEAAPGTLAARVADPESGEVTDSPPEPHATQADDPARCAGHTRSGSRCTRQAEPGSAFCWQHAPNA